MIQKAGLPRKDFFIYQDDLEHAFRVGKYGRIICIPSVLIHHKDNYLYGDDVTWRDYYATRNVILMYQEHLDKKSTWLRGFEPIYNDGGDTIYLEDQLESKKDKSNQRSREGRKEWKNRNTSRVQAGMEGVNRIFILL